MRSGIVVGSGFGGKGCREALAIQRAYWNIENTACTKKDHKRPTSPDLPGLS
jgi:hypothetical protein